MAIFNLFNGRVPASAIGGSATYGIKFQSSVAGQITGIKFYKNAANTNNTKAKFYSDAGALLASKVRTGDGTSGWTTITFDTPVPMTAATLYHAFVYMDGSHYYEGNSASSPAFNPLSSTATAGRYGGGDVYPAGTFNEYYAIDPVFDDLGNYQFPTLASARHEMGCNSFLKGVVVDNVSMYPGSVRSDVEGYKTAPCLVLPIPGSFSFSWGVSAGARTISVAAKQVSNVAGKRPRLIVRANPEVGLATDVIGDAPAGIGWVTIGPLTVTPTSAGVLKVELCNMDTATFDSPAFFDHIVAK